MRTDKMRLHDGARAIQALSEPEPTTFEDLKAQWELVFNRARALQSLDDLGSPQANKAAWDDMKRLEERMKYLEKKIEALQVSK